MSIITYGNDEQKLRNLAQEGRLAFEGGSAPFKPSPGEEDGFQDPGFAPLVVLVAAVTVGYLATVAFRLWGDFKYGGLIIDTTKDPPLFREHVALQRGHVIVITSAGTQEFQPQNETELAAILKEVLK